MAREMVNLSNKLENIKEQLLEHPQLVDNYNVKFIFYLMYIEGCLNFSLIYNIETQQGIFWTIANVWRENWGDRRAQDGLAGR